MVLKAVIVSASVPLLCPSLCLLLSLRCVRHRICFCPFAVFGRVGVTCRDDRHKVQSNVAFAPDRCLNSMSSCLLHTDLVLMLMLRQIAVTIAVCHHCMGSLIADIAPGSDLTFA